MAKSQKKSSRETKKAKAVDQPKSKAPKYMESSTTLSAPKVIVPDKRKK